MRPLLLLATFLSSTVGLSPAFAALSLPAGAQPGDAATYHYDNLRSGWNQSETQLTPATVKSGQFGLIAQVPLDEQVDAQPLFIGGQAIAGQGTHDVVYVVTENDTVYAIDAKTGAVLIKNNLGTPVPESALPGQCTNNSDVVGITSTPAIDRSAGLMYVITYTSESSGPVYRLHALSLSTLGDTAASVIVSGTGTSTTGKSVAFNPVHSRQRAGLLETSGNIYAGFASWCDIDSDVSRGWVLGWNAGSLVPLPASMLMNRRARSRDDFFLTSVWMSGFGISSDDAGNLFLATGNSDYSGTTYNSTINLSESVVRLSADLTTVEDFFTPRGTNGWRPLDRNDGDFGSGGVLLLPAQSGSVPNLAVAAGKTGPMYLLNRDHLGGLTTSAGTLGAYPSDGCWCGPSYYVGSDGLGRVVESTGQVVRVLKVSPTPALSLESTSQPIISGQDPGFFTTVSSNGTQAGTAVVWAVGRPVSFNPGTVTLYAMDPGNGAAQIFSGAAGTWPNGSNANANLVPVVANGHVFVASYANLSIFGLSSSGMHVAFRAPPAPALAETAIAGHVLHGTVTALVPGQQLSLRLRDGRVLQVDFAKAAKAGQVAPPSVGHASLVRGEYGGPGVFLARTILHAKDSPLLWLPDR